MLTATPVNGDCLVCHWHGPRTKRGAIPSHPVTLRGFKTPGGKARCSGPDADRMLARAIGAAFYTAGQCRMPDRRTLTQTVPIGAQFYAPDLYRAAPSWARFLVTVHAPLTDDATGGRRTVAHYFADRSVAEEWARTCAIALGAPGVRSEFAGYVAVSVMHRAMKRWEAMNRSIGSRTRAECAPESPIAYTAIDPGGVVVRFTEPTESYPGYGDAAPRSLWDRVWP